MTFLAGCVGVRLSEPAALCASILSAQGAPGPQSLHGEDETGLGAAVVPFLSGGDDFASGATADGRWVLAFDARLDDRRALARALGLTGVPCSGALLLAAWLRWGADTPKHLCGDYAVIAWDRAERALILARDPFGQRPLFFRAAGAGFACASMPAGLAASLGKALRPDLDRLAADLNHEVEVGAASYFDGIERVEPGQSVTLRAGRKPVRRRHWQPDTTPLAGRSVAEWGEALRAALLGAAADRLPKAGAVGSHLSAGLDSAGVTAAVSRSGAEVTALTAVPAPGAPLIVPPGRLADEAPLAAATAAHLGIAHVPVSADQSFVTLLGDAFGHLAQPIPNPFNHPWAHAIFKESARRGLAVLMCGQSGNLTFSVGAARPAGDSRLRAAARAVMPSWLIAKWRGTRSNPADWTLSAQILPPEPPRPPADQALAILRAMDPGALMRASHQRWGVDLLDVTADRRIAELALRIPDAQRISDGLDRAPARLALAGLVPDAVRLSTVRGYQAADWLHAMTLALPAIRAEVAAIAASSTARSLIDVARLQDLVDAWPRSSAYDPAAERLYRHVVPQAMAIAGWARRAMGET